MGSSAGEDGRTQRGNISRCMVGGCTTGLQAMGGGRGPIDVVRLSLHRLGWSWPRAWEFRSSAEETYNAGTMSPALIRLQLPAAAKATLERQVARGEGKKIERIPDGCRVALNSCLVIGCLAV